MAGCPDDHAWVNYRSQARVTEHRQLERELAAQRRTMGQMAVDARECLDWLLPDEACWRELALYRTCLEAGGSDATCRGRP